MLQFDCGKGEKHYLAPKPVYMGRFILTACSISVQHLWLQAILNDVYVLVFGIYESVVQKARYLGNRQGICITSHRRQGEM